LSSHATQMFKAGFTLDTHTHAVEGLGADVACRVRAELRTALGKAGKKGC